MRGAAVKEAPRNPCRGCDRRSPHCHGKCETYLAYWRFNREQDSIRYNEGQLDQIRVAACRRINDYVHRMKGKKT